MQQSQTVELPHEAFINPEDNRITFSLGNVNLVFTLEEWNTFCEMIDDINIVLQANLIEQSQHCSACGHVDISVLYEEPSDGDLN